MAPAALIAPRQDAFALCACVLVATLVQAWIVLGAQTVMSAGDSMHYLLLADFYAGVFHGSNDAAAVDLYRESRFPPLFPLLLGALGAGPERQPLAYLLSSGCAVLAVALAWLWVRRTARGSVAACVVALGLALNPGFFLLSLNPMSEPLGMALCLGTLLASPAVAAPGPRLRAAAMLAGVACLARSASIALPAGMLVWGHRLRAPALLGTLVLAAGPLLLWMLHRRGIDGAGSYLHSLDPRWIVEQLGGWPQLLYRQPLRLFDAFVHNFAPHSGPVAVAAGAGIALAAAIGCVRRCVLNALDAWFLAVYLALVAVWPFPSEASRLLLFVLPVALLHAHAGIEALRVRCGVRAGPGASTVVLGVLLAMASGGSLIEFARRAALPVEAELAAHKREQVFFLAPDRAGAIHALERIATELNTVREAARVVPDGQCVYAVEPALLRLHAGVRATQYPRRLDETLPAEAQLGACRYFYVSASAYAGGGFASFHLADRIAPFTEPLLLARLDQGAGPVPVAVLLVRRDQAPDARASGSDPRE